MAKVREQTGKKASSLAIFKSGEEIVTNFQKYVDKKGFINKYQTFNKGRCKFEPSKF